MKSIVFICPYFGTLPKEQIDLWLQSCELNSDINWIIFTDDKTAYNYPKNILVKYIKFEDFKKMIQKKFDFNISLENAYKLCDYKPAYGYIFHDYIKDYDFWGYCDMSDCIFGNIRHFITENILDKYDKIGYLGHLTLYKNQDDINKRFMLGTKSKITYKDILSTKENMAFDELNSYSINTIYAENNFRSLRIDDYYYDVSPLFFSFRRSIYDEAYHNKCLKRIPTIFKWEKGKLYEYCVIENKINKEEKLYVHFQKRKMSKEFVERSNQYYIVPNKFILDVDSMNSERICKLTKNKIYPQYFKLKYKSLKYRIKKIMKG